MADRFNFTKAKLDALRVPAGKDRVTVHDAEGRHRSRDAAGLMRAGELLRRAISPP